MALIERAIGRLAHHGGVAVDGRGGRVTILLNTTAGDDGGVVLGEAVGPVAGVVGRVGRAGAVLGEGPGVTVGDGLVEADLVVGHRGRAADDVDRPVDIGRAGEVDRVEGRGGGVLGRGRVTRRGRVAAGRGRAGRDGQGAGGEVAVGICGDRRDRGVVEDVGQADGHRHRGRVHDGDHAGHVVVLEEGLLGHRDGPGVAPRVAREHALERRVGGLLDRPLVALVVRAGRRLAHHGGVAVDGHGDLVVGAGLGDLGPVRLRVAVEAVPRIHRRVRGAGEGLVVVEGVCTVGSGP